MTESRGGMPVVWAEVPAEVLVRRCIVPWPVVAGSPEEAQEQAQRMAKQLRELSAEGHRPIIVTEDRWRRQQEMMKARLLAHLEVFTPMFARNCEVRKIDKKTAAAFLNENHSYGDAACRYRYGLYLKRYTGKRGEISPLASLGRNDSEEFGRNDSEELGRNDSESAVEGGDVKDCITPGTLVAVATFSNARKWQKGEKTIRSYEWTRYASLPGVRINGGMGKVLKAFIKEVQPDDIMSYADLEWSEGAVYEQLGFSLEGRKDPVAFEVDGRWRRSPVGPGMTRKAGSEMTGEVKLGMTEVISDSHDRTATRCLQNLGSNKYRLKLTEYE